MSSAKWQEEDMESALSEVRSGASRGAERNFGPRGKNFVQALWSVVPQNHMMSKKKVIASADVRISAQNQVMSKKRVIAFTDVQISAQHLVMSKIKS